MASKRSLTPPEPAAITLAERVFRTSMTGLGLEFGFRGRSCRPFRILHTGQPRRLEPLPASLRNRCGVVSRRWRNAVVR